jgi:hypothetical protein
MASDQINWSGVPTEMTQQIFQQGETFLQAQLTASLAADMRAITAASIFATFGTAALGGTLAYWQSNKDPSILLAGLYGVFAMVIAAACGFWAARPVIFHFPGAHPTQWFAIRKHPLSEVLGGEAENYQERITRNESTMASNAGVFWSGLVLAGLSPVVARGAAIASFSLIGVNEISAFYSPFSISE